MAEPDVSERRCCSICAEEADPADPASTTLECGHTFHVACALRWFRYEHTTCPNCRSERTQHVWSRCTPAQRVATLRRKRASLSTAAKRKLSYLDRVRAQSAALCKERKELRRVHAAVFRTEARLRARIRHYRTAERHAFKWLSSLVTSRGTGGPLLHYYGTMPESSVDSDVSSEESDA
jgi:hypothetical protein